MTSSREDKNVFNLILLPKTKPKHYSIENPMYVSLMVFGAVDEI